MKRLLVILLTLSFADFTVAQLNFKVTQSEGYYIHGVIEGSILLQNDTIGDTTSYSSTSFLAKFDSLENYTWIKYFDQINIKSGPVFAMDENDNVYISCSFTDTVNLNDTIKVISPPGFRHLVLVKYDQNGDYLWHKEATNTNSSAINIAVKGNHVFINFGFAGYIEIDSLKIGSLTQTNGDFHIAKFDSKGEFKWYNKIIRRDRHYSNSTSLNFIKVSDKGDLIMAGQLDNTTTDPCLRFDTIKLECSSRHKEIFIARADSNGNALYLKKIAVEEESSFLNRITDLSHDRFYISGSADGNTIFDPLPKFEFGSRRNGFIAKYDIDVNALWVESPSKNYPAWSNYSDVAVDSKGNISSIGAIPWENIIWFPPFDSIKGEDFNNFFVKQDSSGQAICQVADTIEYRQIQVGSNDYTHSFRSAEMGFFGHWGGYTYTVIEVRDDSCNVVRKDSITHYTAPVGIEEIEGEREILIFPNPSSGEFTLELDKTYSDIVIHTRDLFGRLVDQQQFKAGKRLRGEYHLPDGIYLVQIYSREKLIGTGKIMISK